LTSTRRMKVLLATAIAALALGAVGAASASATIVNAKFSYPLVKLTTSGVTIKKNGGSAKSCTLSKAIEFWAEGSSFLGGNEAGGIARFSCTDGTGLKMSFNGLAKYDTVAERYYLYVADPGSQALESPWGPNSYFQATGGTDNWTWVNGSGGTSSTITLNEQWVGSTVTGSEKITITGTLTAKTSSGGLIILSH
jgi:hypothetical protein